MFRSGKLKGNKVGGWRLEIGDWRLEAGVYFQLKCKKKRKNKREGNIYVHGLFTTDF